MLGACLPRIQLFSLISWKREVNRLLLQSGHGRSSPQQCEMRASVPRFSRAANRSLLLFISDCKSRTTGSYHDTHHSYQGGAATCGAVGRRLKVPYVIKYGKYTTQTHESCSRRCKEWECKKQACVAFLARPVAPVGGTYWQQECWISFVLFL